MKNDFSQRFEKARNDAGLSLIEIAEHLNVSIAMINSWYKGDSMPNDIILFKLSTLTSKSISWFKLGQDEKLQNCKICNQETLYDYCLDCRKSDFNEILMMYNIVTSSGFPLRDNDKNAIKQILLKSLDRAKIKRQMFLTKDLEEDRSKILKAVEPYKSNITTRKNWDDFTIKNPSLNLPRSKSIIRRFENWKEIKLALNLPTTKNDSYAYKRYRKNYTKESLNEILPPYFNKMTSKGAWDQFVEENKELDLPYAREISIVFSTWVKAKTELGVFETPAIIDELLDVLEPYKEHITTRKGWDKFITENPSLNLPKSDHLAYKFTNWSTLKKKIGVKMEKEPEWVHEFDNETTKIEYLMMLNDYKPQLVSLRVWDDFRKANPHLKLPTSKVLSKAFGSWNTLKLKLGMELNDGGGNVSKVKRPLTDEEIRDIIAANKDLYDRIEPHKDYMISAIKWNTYRHENRHLKLPNSQKITKYFNSWIEARQIFGLGYMNKGVVLTKEKRQE